jgi:hypothetical protein
MSGVRRALKALWRVFEASSTARLPVVRTTSVPYPPIAVTPVFVAPFPPRWPLFLILAASVSFASAAAISLLLSSAGALQLGTVPFGYAPRIPLFVAFLVWGLLVFSPVLETLLLCWLITLGLRVRLSPGFVVLVSAVVAAGLHSLAWAPWGFIVFPAFLVFGYTFVRWRYLSFAAGFVSATLVHSLHNVVPALAIASRLFQRQ